MTTVAILPDRFFNASQQQRLRELMASWRKARDLDAFLPFHEQRELEALIEAELFASASRAAQRADESGK